MFSELLRNQPPNKEKSRLQSLCLPQSGAWLARPPVLALGLYLSSSEFQTSVKYRIRIAVYRIRIPNIINHAVEKSGYAIEAAEERKFAQHENSCSEQGILFVPLAVESFGGLSATLKKTLKRKVLLADSRTYQSQGHTIAVERLAQSVSVVIVRGSAILLFARVP